MHTHQKIQTARRKNALTFLLQFRSEDKQPVAELQAPQMPLRERVCLITLIYLSHFWLSGKRILVILKIERGNKHWALAEFNLKLYRERQFLAR